MFAGFRLDLNENSLIDFSTYRDEGKRHLDSQKTAVETALEQFVINESGGQTIDGTLLADNWFPHVKADVFLSHSHQDLLLAQGIAGWLHKEFGLSCFIDANVWGYADDLLEILNERYSNKRPNGRGGFIYDHQKCIAASKHIDIMLNVALQRMIDQTEAVFLLSTDNAIHRYDESIHSSTYSPWIYSEIVCSDIVRKKSLEVYRPESWNFDSLNENYALEHRATTEEALRIAYAVSTDHLEVLSAFDLQFWQMQHTLYSFFYPLDMLYINKLGDNVRDLRAAYRDPDHKSLLYRRQGV